MREVKVPDFMQPFEVIVNGVKHVFPAGETVTVEDYIADIIEQSVPPKAEAKVERVMWEDIGNRPFGEEAVLGDTLTWDGNTEGRASFMETYYKVSDAIPSLLELGNAVLSMENGEGDTYVGGFSEMGTNLLGHNYGLVMIALADNVDFAGVAIIPEKGIYFVGAEDGYVSSLTIPGYTGFETKTIKRLDEKYMPILTSPNGTKFKISVGDDGSLSAAEVVEA